MTIVALNAGSSSLKYAVFADAERCDDGDGDVVLRGALDRIGAGGPADHATAVGSVLDELDRRGVERPRAVGHRLVHGGPEHTEPAIVDGALIAGLERAIPFAPLHLPAELAAIAAVRARFGDLPQVVCFDTGFHRTLPRVASQFALPHAWFEAGIRRYGFHGLSYEFIAASLPAAQQRRAVFAHLGSGASMVAVRDGRSIDTTMGLTPTGGLVMATRAGDLDPGLLIYLLDHGHDARSLARLVDHEAGLLAISGTTGDMQRLLELRATAPHAALAIDVFCYQARKSIGALAAVLGGLDTLVFAGGIGEHAPAIRSEICRGLEHLGIALADSANAAGAPIIGTGRCAVHVVRTDEERMIARHVRRLI
ncbi:MAG TPA: acetate/propionate family kinase [Kofleriaceae bacterium]|nr:acetate/propionate family kinase [Kofleriaceae bacterium]